MKFVSTDPLSIHYMVPIPECLENIKKHRREFIAEHRTLPTWVKVSEWDYIDLVAFAKATTSYKEGLDLYLYGMKILKLE